MTIPLASADTQISSASFLARLAVGVLLINLFTLAMVGLALRQSYHQYQERAEISTRNLALVLEREINGNIETDDMALSAVIDEYQQQRTAGVVDGNALNAHIERVRARRPEIDALRITDAQGLLIYGNGVVPGAKVSLADRPHFIRLRDDPKAGLVISKPQISRINQKWVLVLSRRIEQPGGVFAGMAFAAITLDHFSKTFAAINVGANGVSTLRDDDFFLVARYPEQQGAGSMIGQKTVQVPMRELLQAARNEGTFAAISTIDNIERTYSFRRVSNHPLLISVGLAHDDYLAEWRKDAINQATLLAFFALVTLAAAWLIYRTWQRQRNALITVGQREETLKKSEAELQRSNSELEQFSYSISHDMRQPLRMISSYLQLLQNGLGDTLDAEKREFFNFAIDGAQRLDAMLRGLLDYSRIGRKGEPPAWIDSRAALDDALLFLRPAIAEAQAELRIDGEWPRLLASPDELLRLLQNLIGNALKFRVEGRPPVVTVSSEVINGHWRFCVADNGVGILPDQIGRLFQVFQRLQSRTAFEGTGIGLALCRKIAEHHGGKIWAESAGEGLGSRFCVELPLPQEAIEATP
jgi:signal transduction histidine kinase